MKHEPQTEHNEVGQRFTTAFGLLRHKSLACFVGKNRALSDHYLSFSPHRHVKYVRIHYSLLTSTAVVFF